MNDQLKHRNRKNMLFDAVLIVSYLPKRNQLDSRIKESSGLFEADCDFGGSSSLPPIPNRVPAWTESIM